MSEPKYAPDIESVREIKWWLRGCVLNPGLATPMRFLNSAFEAQGGKALRVDFRHTVQNLCPGLTVVERRKQLVVLGIAPRWTREDLIEAIQTCPARTHSDVIDFLDGKEGA